MDEEYNDSVDTSTDMDVSDVDVSDDIPADIPDDIPEDDYSDADVADDFSEDVPEESFEDDVEYDDIDEPVEDDSIESETEEFDESMDDIEEDTLEELEEVSDVYGESDDISEDTDGFDEELENEADEAEDIPEDVDYTEMADQDEEFEEDIPEDVIDTEATNEASDVEDTDTSEQPEDVSDTEATDETTDVEDTDTSDQLEDVTDTETTDETSDVENTDTSEQPEDVSAAEATDETIDVEDTDTSEQLEDVSDAEATDETTDVEDTDASEQPEDVSDAEATEETTDVEDSNTSEQPEDVTDAEATDESTDVESIDTPELSEDVTDAEVTDETSDVEDTDTSEQMKDMTDAEGVDVTTDVEDTDAAEQSEKASDTETTDEKSDVANADAAEQPEDVSDAEIADESSDVENTGTSEQPEDVTDAEARDETTDVEDADAAEQSEKASDTDDANHSDLETYDYETAPETQDAVNPETSGEYVSTDNPYRERWEEFADEFSDGKDESDGWDSLKDVPFSGEEQSDTDASTEGFDATSSVSASGAADVGDSSDTSEINSISDYMNAHNYGPDDFATYSQGPQWRQLMRQEYPDYELPEMTQESANARLSQYMNDHNYGVDDYAEYSQDPIWRELHSTAFPDDELPPLNDAVGKQDVEYPVPASDGIDDLNPPEDNNDLGSNPTKNPDDIDESQLFGSFETDKHINGSDSFVKGDNYEQFKKDYYAPEESSYESYDAPKEVDISPSMIEGIHLGERELEDPNIFWSQHEKDGTLESFKEVASHIPNVREQLASGKTIDELLTDPELSECAGIYFANKPKVIENDGYYEFDSNGRHRILAAREAGYDIPVEVIGRRNRNDGTESQSIDSVVEELHANIGGELSEHPVGENKEFGSFSDKIRNFFTPAKDTDLIEPGTVDLPESKQDVQTKWTPPAIKGVDVKEPEADITPLDSTRQTINLVDLPDGSKARVFDHPNDLRNVLPFSQGKNEYSKNGTCALADTGAWLKIAGSKHVENDVVGFASTHTDRRGQPLCSKSGGTLPSNIPDIWEHFGMPAYSDGSKNLENIAEAVESGRAVSVGVNAGTLWAQDNIEGIKIPQNCYGDGGANHAIGIMSCERDPISENITHFYINDTGRTYERDACRKISISDFWKAFNVKRACATISQKPVW